MHSLKSFYIVVELVRQQINKDMPIQQLAMFLLVADNPGITMTELCDRLKMPQGSVSRNVKQLGFYLDRKAGSARVKGLDLVRTEPDPKNHPRLAVFLTERGKALAAVLQGQDEQKAHGAVARQRPAKVLRVAGVQ